MRYNVYVHVIGYRTLMVMFGGTLCVSIRGVAQYSPSLLSHDEDGASLVFVIKHYARHQNKYVRNMIFSRTYVMTKSIKVMERLTIYAL